MKIILKEYFKFITNGMVNMAFKMTPDHKAMQECG